MNEKELVMHIVSALVEYPDQINIAIVEGEKSTIIELRVAESDLGKIIGKQGRIAKAIRTLLSAGASRSGRRVSLEILD